MSAASNTPTAEDFQRLALTVNSLIDNNAATAAADLALMISIIGNLSAHSANASETIRAIGVQAAGFLGPVLNSDKFPNDFKEAMKSRVDAIINKADETYGGKENSPVQ